MRITASDLGSSGSDAAPLPAWDIPRWKSLFALAVFLPLSLAFGYFGVRVVGQVFAGPESASIGTLLLTVMVLPIILGLFVFFAEAWIVAGVAALAPSPHARIDLDEFHHFQLKQPIRLSSVLTLTIHGSPRLPRMAVTITTDTPFGLRFLSLLNAGRLLRLPGADRQFTFMPGLLSADAGATVVTALTRVVRLNGGRMIHHRRVLEPGRGS